MIQVDYYCKECDSCKVAKLTFIINLIIMILSKYRCGFNFFSLKPNTDVIQLASLIAHMGVRSIYSLVESLCE